MRRIEPIVSSIENGIGKEINMDHTISTKDLKSKLDQIVSDLFETRANQTELTKRVDEMETTR